MNTPTTTKYQKRLVRWDIETGPESDEILQKFYEPMADFDAEACKAEFATARDEGPKGAAFIAKKKAEHEQKQKEHWANFKDKAALNPLTGRILAIGLRENGKSRILVARTDAEEAAIIAEFLNVCIEVIASGGTLEGFNTDGFDLGFVFRRGLKYRLNVHTLRSGRYWHHAFRDILLVWQCGDRTKFISLDTLAEFLGTKTRKNGDGALFAETFAKDPVAALAYLDNDLLMTEEVADAVTFMPTPAPSTEEEDAPFASAAA